MMKVKQESFPYIIFMLDHSIAELARLPYGYAAERESIETEWIIRKK